MQLLDRKGRQKQGQFMIEGTHLIEEALKAKAPVRTIVYDMEKGLPRELRAFNEADVEWVAVTPAIMVKCSDTQTPQGTFAIVDKAASNATELFKLKEALVVALDGVQDPGNLGTIIRSADAVGAHAVVLGRGTVDLYNPKTIRSTMGSLFHLPIIEADLKELLAEAAEQGVQIIGSSLQAESSYYELDLKRASWIVLGNEGQGISAEVEQLVTQQAIIPMHGQAESLNVAMAGTVMLFEAARQRHIGK
ncbi:RNA methyltransferase [Paenibacillus sp. N1-5-1-14]|nr:RNA methyltransferase [Paenibacillus radicibacter]MCR8645334.1 RNA methyltransferase [Paenibacillus radicibacter]